MPDDDDDNRSVADDPARFARQLQAEIAAAAEVRRRRDPELARHERDLERAWAHLAPPGATGPADELLLDRVDRLSMIDVDAPVGVRPGVRQVKAAVRKGTYWYLRYVSDQLNALHNVQSRMLRRIDERLDRLERAAGLDERLAELVDPVPDAGPAVAGAVAASLDRGPVLVVGDPAGAVLGALEAAGIAAYGVHADALAVVEAVGQGFDLRVEEPLVHLRAVEPGSLGGVVVCGFVEHAAIAELIRLAQDAVAAVCAEGRVVVAVAEPSARVGADAELLAGRGLGPEAWARLLERAGGSVSLSAVDDSRIARLVVARRL